MSNNNSENKQLVLFLDEEDGEAAALDKVDSNVYSNSCLHDWHVYNGAHLSDIYCIKCGHTRPLDPSK